MIDLLVKDSLKSGISEKVLRKNVKKVATIRKKRRKKMFKDILREYKCDERQRLYQVQPQLLIVVTVHYVVVVCLRKLYFQLVLDCVAGVVARCVI